MSRDSTSEQCDASTSRALVAMAQFRDWRRTFILGVLNGVLFRVGMAFTFPSTVLATFVMRLTGSEFAAGILGTIDGAGWFLPQLFVVSYL
ncbi:MAG TPA: hypothetical protein EYP10_15525, partial [Armatimonadetes bacterium]|nr:hypothetical protein [Armatimonadota bacterium]